DRTRAAAADRQLAVRDRDGRELRHLLLRAGVRALHSPRLGAVTLSAARGDRRSGRARRVRVRRARRPGPDADRFLLALPRSAEPVLVRLLRPGMVAGAAS